jgi:hypothetical protein
MNSGTPHEKLVVSVTVPGVGELRAGGLVVVVAPNSSGKTQFLRDIYSRITGQPRAFVVCDSLLVQKPPSFDAFVQHLIDLGSLRRTDAAGIIRLEATVPHFGTGAGPPGDINVNDAKGWYDSFSSGSVGRQSLALKDS